jgi:sigma-B regulation protein RsbU (phosphoserine phosphatase)
MQGKTLQLAPAPHDDVFRMLVESVHDYAIFMLDPNGFITTWNAGAERIKGYAANEIIGKHFSVFYPPQDVSSGKPAWELEEAARVGRFEDEGWRLRNDGTRFWSNVVITAVRDSAGVLIGYGKVTRDLTVRREAEETARRLSVEQAARSEAEKAETYQRNLLAIVAHDLRNCLSVVLTAGEMIRVHADDLEKVRRRAAQIVTSAGRMRQIIHGIIDYTYAQRAEGLPVSPKDGADVHGVCQRVLQELRLLHPGRSLVYEAEGSSHGEWDEGRLEQVVENLLGNALKYSPPGTPVTLRWSRLGDPSEGDLSLTVHNEGAPIPADLLPHVFMPFRSGEREGSGTTESLGLGLFIVKEIVRAHGGEVRVQSDAQSGTTFSVRLPARRGIAGAP